MSGLAILFLFFVSHADSASMDEKRLNEFKSFMLKKEALEMERQNAAESEKRRREKRESSYESVRSSFKRPPVVEPPGKDDYARKMDELEKSYDRMRKVYADKQKKIADTYNEKMDQTKMIEYEL
jgi:flagellar biosynthesis GTPase FlhF